MMKYIPIILIPFLFLGCFNKTGISAKYYANECSEYYGMQGFYHKDCKDDNVISYKEIKKQKDKRHLQQKTKKRVRKKVKG